MNRFDARLVRALLKNREWARVAVVGTICGGEFKLRHLSYVGAVRAERTIHG